MMLLSQNNRFYRYTCFLSIDIDTFSIRSFLDTLFYYIFVRFGLIFNGITFLKTRLIISNVVCRSQLPPTHHFYCGAKRCSREAALAYQLNDNPEQRQLSWTTHSAESLCLCPLSPHLILQLRVKYFSFKTTFSQFYTPDS